MKLYVISHMNASVDGRILGSGWRPAENRMAGLFERLHDELGGGSWLIGRVTGSEYAKATSYPDRTDQTYPRQPWFTRRDAAAYGIALDAQGKIAWGRSDIGGDPILVVLAERGRRADPLDDSGEHRGAGGRRGLAPLPAAEPLSRQGDRAGRAASPPPCPPLDGGGLGGGERADAGRRTGLRASGRRRR